MSVLVLLPLTSCPPWKVLSLHSVISSPQHERATVVHRHTHTCTRLVLKGVRGNAVKTNASGRRQIRQSYFSLGSLFLGSLCGAPKRDLSFSLTSLVHVLMRHKRGTHRANAYSLMEIVFSFIQVAWKTNCKTPCNRTHQNQRVKFCFHSTLLCPFQSRFFKSASPNVESRQTQTKRKVAIRSSNQ